MTFTLGKIKPNVPHAEVALWDTIPLLSSLMDDAAFLGSRVLPLVEDTAEDWYVAHYHDSPDGSYSLQIFVWPPGSWTRIHDHSTWGGFFCAVGSMLEVRYERLDNGSVPYHAHLKELWRVAWGRSQPSRCTFTVRGSGRSTGGTTTLLETTSATGHTIDEIRTRKQTGGIA